MVSHFPLTSAFDPISALTLTSIHNNPARDDSTSPLELFGLISVIMCIFFGGLYVHLKSPALPADPFLVIDIPGRGKGVVAARDIQVGHNYMSSTVYLELLVHTYEKGRGTFNP